MRLPPAASVLVPGLALGVGLTLAGCGSEAAKSPAPARPPADGSAPVASAAAPGVNPSMEAEVRDNILSQPVGSGTVADLALPPAILERLQDRVIRSSYQDEFHRFVGADAELPARPIGPATAPADALIVLEHALSPALASMNLAEARPGRRGFIAPIRSAAPGRERVQPEAADPGEPNLEPLSRTITAHLAPNGLLVTLARVVEELGTGRVLEDPADALERLHAAGFPIDLLPCFARGGAGDVEGVVVATARIVSDEGSADAAARRLADVPFRWAPGVPGFTVMTESGEADIETVRLQLTRGTYWRAPGAGGSLDVARQLVERLPEANFVASVEARFRDDLIALAATWPLARAGRLTLVLEPLTVSQWAQDNAKPGRAEGAAVHLVPRYASRREDGSVFVPGESALADGLAEAGLTVRQSRLLFQGGNLLAVRHPATGERWLLVGEAELYRNVALGLTEDQARTAFRLEFGVDRVEVLPAVAFHIDYDLTVRAVGDRLVAFVNDPMTAAQAIVALAAERFSNEGLIDRGVALRLPSMFEAGDDLAALRAIGGPLMQVAAVNDGAYPVRLAQALMANPAESAIANLRPVLCALDTIHAQHTPMPVIEREGFRYADAYLRAYHRTVDARTALHGRLAELGLEVVPVPGLPEGERGIIYVNGVHDRTRYLMPAWGGAFASLDRRAQQAIQTALGADIEVVPILCAETQRRNGALHCAMSVVYAE